MWTRIKESELVIRQSSLPARVVLERNSLPTEYRTHLEMIQKGGEAMFLHGRMFEELKQAQEDFERRRQRLLRRLPPLRPGGLNVLSKPKLGHFPRSAPVPATSSRPCHGVTIP